MLQISFEGDVKDLRRTMSAWSEREMPFAVARALTWSAQDAQKAVVAEMKTAFDRPTWLTLNGTYIVAAQKFKWDEARVGFKDYIPKGTPAFKYLMPEVRGGERRVKRFERAMKHYGILPNDMMTVPGKRAKLDRFGNMNQGQIAKILSYLQSSPDPSQNKAEGDGKGKRKSERYFVGTFNGNNSPYGVWQVEESHLLPILIFVKKVHYKPRLPFHSIVHSTVQDVFRSNFRKAMVEGMRETQHRRLGRARKGRWSPTP